MTELEFYDKIKATLKDDKGRVKKTKYAILYDRKCYPSDMMKILTDFGVLEPAVTKEEIKDLEERLLGDKKKEEQDEKNEEHPAMIVHDTVNDAEPVAIDPSNKVEEEKKVTPKEEWFTGEISEEEKAYMLSTYEINYDAMSPQAVEEIRKKQKEFESSMDDEEHTPV